MRMVSDARGRRSLRRARSLDFEAVKDPRMRGRLDHGALLRLLVVSVASGKQALRAVESVGDSLSAAVLKALGLKRPPSDTALYELLARQSVGGFAQVLVRQVKDALLRKEIGNDLFDEGVVAIDGKSVWTGMFAADPSCCDQKSEGRPVHVLRAQRACLVSSSARPVVTQKIIAKSAGESDTFPATFAFLVKQFGRSFEVITHDAGGTSRANAELVNAAGKTYVFAIKGSQPRVHAAAKTRLGCAEFPDDHRLVFESCTEERADGATVRREIVRCAAQADDPDIEFAGARQLWRVRQTTLRLLPTGRVEATAEDRYFITNRVLAAAKALRLVRLHWGIENGPNWTMDCVLGEDAGSPCRSGRGIVVFSWLRLLAYNLLSMWRRKLPPRRDQPVASWRWACETLLSALRPPALLISDFL